LNSGARETHLKLAVELGRKATSQFDHQL